MTSRTIDISCDSCRKYLFSLMPDDVKGLKKCYFCNSELCKEAAIVAKLQGEKVKIKK